ncbi:hypothetical protein ICM05_03385 [Leucobacter sp. cx-42]|uniref:hypothetical protein n=1 Tax=unclassified Leucobacter TaxID=2621730 RepID=UPI00165E7419|nr:MULTISPECIES: hypothetical protein [unclassified Leucobacter]MBC9953696.1 hypothetical protein [Leucobacter sp. cx-42]
MQALSTVHAEPEFSNESPNYRVNIWHRQTSCYALDAYYLTGVRDAYEALAWAKQQAAGNLYEVFVEASDSSDTPFRVPRTAGLVRLFGENPNAVDEGVTSVFRLTEDLSGS